MKIHLYQIQSTPDDFDLAARLRLIAADDLEHRNRTRDGEGIRLETMYEDSGLMYCDFIKIRTEHGPAKVGFNTPAEGFELETDEGFGEETAMLYDPGRGYVVLQYNHHGCRDNAIADYLAGYLHGHFCFLSFNPVLDRDVRSKIQSSGLLKKLTLSVAARDLSDDDYAGNPTIGYAIQSLGRNLDAEKVEITISAGRGKEKGLQFSALNLLKWVRTFGRDTRISPVKSAKVTVQAENGNAASIVLDLLEQRMVAEIELQPGDDKRYPRDNRWRALHAVHDHWLSEMT